VSKAITLSAVQQELRSQKWACGVRSEQPRLGHSVTCEVNSVSEMNQARRDMNIYRRFGKL
jgi:hypothetical protein